MALTYWNDTTWSGGNELHFGMWSVIAVLFILTSTLMVVSNIFCLIMLYRSRVLEESMMVFMTSLNAADLGCGLLMGIPSTIQWIMG